MPHVIHCFLPDGTIGEEQIQVTDEHPETGEAELGRVMGVHFIHELGGHVAALFDVGEAFGFAALDAAALFVDDDVVVVDPSQPDRFGIAFDGLQDGSNGADDQTLWFGADGSLLVNGGTAPEGWDYVVQVNADRYDIEAAIPTDALADDFRHLRKMGVNVSL